ncbi:hypothetical protein D7V97_28095 [Corallococcus sp. CA053C]|uniref:CARDB domain-containing protein n=1 Tax=Corallococcus sp. CA053C TaxID=2316732 RepID=UPI000EA06DC8|nr:CARDB domain-containing protein [Corallococcus sp. CA053C]RKH02270.1 hypothetical protein D7V97_28095 [Corallococcus sp. CA053C]
MPRPTPSWRRSCLLIAGTLVFTGCGGDAPSEAALSKSQTDSLLQGPDLVITELRGPASVRDGYPFTVSARVCNRGTAPISPSGTLALQVYLSTTATQQVPAPGAPPTTQQVTVGEVTLGMPLEPEQCVTPSLSVTATRPSASTPNGALYLGASVDTRKVVTEVNETNNSLVSGLMGVGTLADLVVTEVKAPASARPGDSFPVTLRACNVGTSPASSSNVRLYVSTLATLTLPAPGASLPTTLAQVGDVSVPSLDVGACLSLPTQASAVRPPAATTPEQPLYLGAFTDPVRTVLELREDNNAHVAGRLGIGNQPDLVVTDVTGPDSLRSSAPFFASVRVCNVGTEPALNPRAELFLSTQATLSPGATNPGSQTEALVGSAQGMRLDAGRCTTLSMQGNAFLPPAAVPNTPLYLGARVDGQLQIPELREDNNTFVKGLVGVGTGSDLVVRSLKAPATARRNGPFTAEAKVCNVGTEMSNSARVELFLSTESPVVFPSQSGPIATSTQVPVGGMDVPSLSAGGCVIRSVSAWAQPPPEAVPSQPLYLGAAVDTQRNNPELREDNNTFTAGPLGVGDDADLIITELRAPASLQDGQSFAATYTVCNQGLWPTNGFGISLFLSSEAAPPAPQSPPYGMPPPGYALQGRWDSSLHVEAGQCISQRSFFTAWRPPNSPPDQPLYLSATVDTTSLELRRDNNGFAAGRVGLGQGADLVVTEVKAPASARSGSTFTTSVRVCNVGTQPSSSSLVEVYLSSEPTLVVTSPPGPDSSRAFVNGVPVPSLGVGACITREISGQSVPPPSASLQQPVYVGAIVDPGSSQPELREDNNTLVGGMMSLASGPDLVVTSLDAPASITPGGAFSASARVCNVGTDPSSSSDVAIILSTDDTWSPPVVGMPPPPAISSSQANIGSLPVPPLQPGQCAAPFGTMSSYGPTASLPGQPLYVGATVDPFQSRPELREDNNVFVKGRIGYGFGPDLVVTGVTGPASVLPGQSFTATITVCNQGTQPAPQGARVDLYVLSNTTVPMPPPGMAPSPSQSAGWSTLDPLEPNTCVSTPVPANAYVPGPTDSLPFFLGASVDTLQFTQELREDNNTFLGPRIGVGTGPDLIITSMGGPASVMPGNSMRIPVTVCNQGQAPSQAQPLEVFLSTEPVLPEPSSTGMGMEMSSTLSRLGMMDVPPLQPNACATREESFYAYPPSAATPFAPVYLGAALVVTGSSPGQELRTDNNTFVRGRIGVGNAPDLVITEVTAPFSVRYNEQLTTTVKVCNQGTTAPSGTSSGRVELFLSTQSSLEFPSGPGTSSFQVSLGFVDLGALQPQQCTTRQLTTPVLTPSGSPGFGLFYIGALVDSQRTLVELREDNNAYVQGFLAVMP